MHSLLAFLTTAGFCFLGVFVIAIFLSFVGSLGSFGQRIVGVFTRAPWLDFWVAAITWVPWVFACIAIGWRGIIASLIGQGFALALWCGWHELIHPTARKGPRIVKFINRTVGRWRNHLALWVTLIALPGFWFIRFVQLFAYWPLVVLLKFPNYKQSEWINVSRHKFDGLVGHDLVWCLYCDWMTGVYSLGAEMLRNVESFWCPIRFYDGKKCENCTLDFPDISNGWVSPEARMSDVEAVMEEKYSGDNKSWFGHPTRLTVKGKDV